MSEHDDFYESARLVSEYLLFHYGKPEEILPWDEGPKTALEFPQRCAQLLIKHAEEKGSVLDLGCAVGRSTFELATHFDRALGVDYSQAFVAAAERMRDEGAASVKVTDEGVMLKDLSVSAPATKPEFAHGDACALSEELGSFDAVLMANLVCRLHDPAACLQRLPELVNPGGTLVITTPNTWLEEFTPRDRWMAQGEQRTLDGLKDALADSFECIDTCDMPFLIREHARKYQWTVAEASVWRRK